MKVNLIAFQQDGAILTAITDEVRDSHGQAKLDSFEYKLDYLFKACKANRIRVTFSLDVQFDVFKKDFALQKLEEYLSNNKDN